MSTIKMQPAKRKTRASRSGSETLLVTNTLNTLRWFIPDGLFWRNNSGMVTTQTGTVVKLAPAGTADIVGLIMPWGMFVALEAKVPSRRANVSDKQKHWLKDVEKIGGYAGVFCTIEEALDHIAKAKKMQLERFNNFIKPLDSSIPESGGSDH